MNTNTETSTLNAEDDALLNALLGDDIIEPDLSMLALESDDVLVTAAVNEAAPVAAEPSVEPVASAPVKKAKKAKKAPVAAEPSVDAAPVIPKEPRATTITHKPGDLLVAKLGAHAADMLVFNMNDATLAADELKAKQDAFIASMNDQNQIAIKVREKIIQLLTGLAAGSAMNEVLRRAFTVLKEDGKLTSGDKGNLQVNLLAKPYSLGTSRSQAAQCFMVFPLLGITIKEKGIMIPNEDSTVLAAAWAQLGL